MTTAQQQLLPTARRRAVPRRRRRQAYGVSTPGAYSSTPAWWSREHWRSELLADLQSQDVHQLRSSVGTRGPVSCRAIYAVATAISAAADGATGRNAMPGNTALSTKASELDPDSANYWARVATSSGYGLTTIQKAVQVLAARGWLALIRTGKNYLTREDRTEMWRAGTAARQRRNVWACTLPPHVRQPVPQRPAEGCRGADSPAPPARTQPPPVDNSTASDTSAGLGCDLPTTRRVRWVSSVEMDNYFKPERASRTGAPRRAPSKDGHTHRTYRADTRVVRLAKDLRARLPWLRHVPHQRIMPSLHRFAVQGWTARDVQVHLDQLIKQRGWTVPGGPGEAVRDYTGQVHQRSASTMRSPWGYLAYLLRHLDPGDLAAEQAYAAETAAREEYQRQLVFGPPCVHGQPAGDVPSPTRGVLACLECRRQRRPHD
jgi:hypothetical protein